MGSCCSSLDTVANNPPADAASQRASNKKESPLDSASSGTSNSSSPEREDPKNIWSAIRSGKNALHSVLIELLPESSDQASLVLDQYDDASRKAGQRLVHILSEGHDGDENGDQLLQTVRSILKVYGTGAGNGRPSVASYLGDGLNVDRTGGLTPLIAHFVRMQSSHLSAVVGPNDVAIVRALLDAGADPRGVTAFGLSPLHEFLGSSFEQNDNYFAIVKALIDAGADPMQREFEQDETPFQWRPQFCVGVGGEFGSGQWKDVLGCCQWEEIQRVITDAKAHEGDEEESLRKLCGGLADLGWGKGAQREDIEVKGSGRIRDRLQIANQVLEGQACETLYLYFWDDGEEYYKGWWVTPDSIGSNNWYMQARAEHSAEFPDAAMMWESVAEDTDEETRFERIRPDSNAAESPVESGFVLRYPGSFLDSKKFLKEPEMHHGKPVYVHRGDSPLRMDRCRLITEQILLPLLRQCGQQNLTNDCIPAKALCRYLLDSGVAVSDKYEVMTVCQRGLNAIEEELAHEYDRVKEKLASGCGPVKALTGLALENKWPMLHQREAHGQLSWLEGKSMTDCILVLMECGYTLEDVCLLMTRHGWMEKSSFYSTTYALWLIAEAKKVDPIIYGVVNTHFPGRTKSGPIKSFERTFAKGGDYTEESKAAYPCDTLKLDDSHLYEIGGVVDLTRVAVECEDANELVDAYRSLLALRLASGDKIEVVRTKNGFSPDAESSGGYRDVKLNVIVRSEDDGAVSVGEIQLVLKKYLEAKKHMHLLYKVVRGDIF